MSQKEPPLAAEKVLPASSPIERIRGEYIEMPGLSLTVTQAARFWGLNAGTLEQSLSSLVESGFLVCDKAGCYRRSD